MGFEIFYESPTYIQGLASGILLIVFIKWILGCISRRKKLPPGPIGFPIVGYFPFLVKEPYKTLWNMRNKYGDVFSIRLGPKYTIVLNEYKVAKEVICHPHALHRAPNLFDHVPEPGFITKNGAEWIEQRRFTFSCAKDLGLGRGEWEDLMMDEVSQFVQILRDSRCQPIEISNSLGASIASTLISLLIGRQLKKDDESEKIEQSLEYADAAIRYMGPVCASSLVPGLRKVFEIFGIAGYDKAAKTIAIFQKFFKDEVFRHKTSPEFKQCKDFINLYLKKLTEISTSGDKNHYFSEKMLLGSLNLLYLGALDTTFSSVGWLLRLMAKYQDVQARVRKELLEVLGLSGKSSFGERHKIPYTFAVVMEMERFATIVPFSMTRIASGDIEIGAYSIPKGAEITANLWGLHHDPDYWQNPDQFMPDRFLTKDGRILRNPPSYAPFSLGRRNCPGQTVAWMQILAYFTEIVKQFEICMPPGIEPHFEVDSGLISKLEPQELCFRRRTG